MSRLIFLDTETTGLDRRTRRIWDLAYIVRDPDVGPVDVEHQHYLDVQLHKADPFSLDIGRYWQRHPNPYRDYPGPVEDGTTLTHQLVHQVARDFKGATLVGAVPSFDEETLARLLRSYGLRETWHYRLLDVETLAAGRLGWAPPWSFDKVLAGFGLTYSEEDRHTALGDARMVRDLYDMVLLDGPAALAQSTAAEPVGRCSRCGRRTWELEALSTVDLMTQPDGSRCGGVFRPAGA